MGRNRGPLTTKIRVLSDARKLPIRLTLTPGQAHDSQAVTELLSGLTRRCVALADKAYDANWIRAHIETQVAAPNIAFKANRT